jgi:hypothetical protein
LKYQSKENPLTERQIATKNKVRFEAPCHFMGNERGAGAGQLVAVSSRSFRIFFTFFFGVIV